MTTDVKLEEIIALERLNYAAMQPMVDVTPGVELILRDDVIITSSQVFPSPDVNHACLLRATPDTAPDLVAEVMEHFTSRELPPTIFVSPACAPENLHDVLLEQGLTRQKEQEAWLVLEKGDDLVRSKPPGKVEVHSIDKSEALTYSKVFMQAFGMPDEYAGYMAEVLEPSIGLPGMYHYIATFNGQPTGICTLICHQKLAIVGSAGIISKRRGLKVLTGLTAKIYADGYDYGCKRALLQTTAGTTFERVLRIAGFKTYFTRACYTIA